MIKENNMVIEKPPDDEEHKAEQIVEEPALPVDADPIVCCRMTKGRVRKIPLS